MRFPFKRPGRTLWRYVWRGIKLSVLAAVLLFLWCGGEVYYYAQQTLPEDYRGDAAVVLGAAAWDVRPSPVFRERINHAIVLYQSGKVGKLAFTGGTPKPGFMTEAEVGRRYASRQGVPLRDMVLENTSRDTYGNLRNIRPVLAGQGLGRVVLVSDPFHLARAAAMARRLGLAADLSPTPTTRYSKGWEKWRFWWQETSLLFAYYVADWGGRLLDWVVPSARRLPDSE
ncbi:YdcF family protein [Neisseria leonii]|uniref:YdcF family protein n=1 Tax=Neisseria leonii TaxID=2995413 RepID=A0A9X4E3A2_9NEIS|nr:MULTISPECIES: YdcF family protein [unclassified Neisseria]MDD9326544.1 YdcF family protein [Neisseria sp. 3986]MDD9328653.1 YdcF family protein [Neisseria sp. 51.81]